MVPSLTRKDYSVPSRYKSTFQCDKRNTFVRTIVPKSSIMDKFVPLEIRNSEQLVTFLAINDNFVLKKCQSTFLFRQKERKERNNLFSLFKKGPFQNED